MTVNEALCKGCGACNAACPSGAISLRHFKAEQIIAQIREVCYCGFRLPMPRLRRQELRNVKC